MMKSITSRLITLLTFCSATILILGMLLDYHLSREEILESLRNEALATVDGVVTDMENWLDGVEGATLFLARILEQRDYSHEGLEQMLKNIVENNEDIFGAAIALNPQRVDDPLGFAPYYFHRQGILTYTDLAGEQYNYREQAWYTDTVSAGQPLWVEPYFDRGGGEVLMTTFAVPVYRVNEDGGRSLYAVVTADVALAELHSYLQRLRMGESGFATLFSRRGVILSARRPGDIMRHYSQISALKPEIATWRELFQAALAGQVLTRQLPCPQVPGRCIIRMGALQTTGWPVGIIYSEEEFLAPLGEFRIKAAIIGGATLLLMVLAVVLVTRRLTRPLSALARASDDIARGELNTPLPRARGDDEVARLVRSFAAMKKDLKAYIADLEEVTASRSRLQGELTAARQIQMSMLPGGGETVELDEQYSLWAKVRPARSVGGDLYTYYHSDGRLFLAIGDVSDKGVPAALFMAKAISIIQQLAGTDTAPGEAMAQINDVLEQGNDNCMFVTLFLGVLDLGTRQLRYASAGHTPPSLLRDTNVQTLVQADGPALGLAAGLVYPQNTLQLRPGDRLAIFTDGIDEAFNGEREMFGIERFNHCLAHCHTSPLAAAGAQLFEAVDNFVGATPQSDDIAVMLLQLPDKAAVETTAADCAVQTFQRGPRLTSRVLDWLQAILASKGVEEGIAVELALVTEEMVTNVDKYAGLADDAAVEIRIEWVSGGIAVELIDQGTEFNPLEQGRRSPLGADSDSAEIGGHGVHLITRLTEQQSYRREGGCNILRVIKTLPK